MATRKIEATETPPVFTPFTLRGMTLENRIVMSPMCMYTADDGTPCDFHVVHLGSRALGGAGLVFSEMTQVSPEGRISIGDAGIWHDKHIEPWKRVVDFVHTHTSAKIGMQLGHAGRKASTPLPWNRGRPLPKKDQWDIIAPSAIPFSPDSQTPHAMNQGDLARIKQCFVDGAIRAKAAGFDMVEIHGAHGYLLSSFISPLSNRRTDGYGGSLEARMRYPLEVFHAVRAVWPEEKPVSVRISAYDWVDGGTTAEDAVEIARMFQDAGLDIIDVSTGAVTDFKRPQMPGLFQTPFSEKIRAETGLPTMTVGNISTPEQMNDIIASGRADLCCLAKGYLYDPFMALHAARALGYDGLPWPRQYTAARMFDPEGS